MEEPKEKHRKSDRGISRRTLMSCAGALAAFAVVPRHVLGGPGRTAPSEKLNIAGVGVGGQRAWDLENVSSENIVALCDVDQARAAETFNRYPKAKKYRDFRVMLDKEKEIDAVVVATPDHVHAVATMAAIKTGKHVYCEKPLTRTVYEARAIAEAAREAGVATQMGNQGMAFEGNRLINEWLWDGNSPRLIPEDRMRTYKRPPKTLPRSIGHHKEWIQACKTGSPTRSNFGFAGPLTEAVLLGTVCVRMGGGKLIWDSKNMKVTNLPEANEYLHYEYRAGWTL